jgi:hypothetical protein
MMNMTYPLNPRVLLSYVAAGSNGIQDVEDAVKHTKLALKSWFQKARLVKGPISFLQFFRSVRL